MPKVRAKATIQNAKAPNKVGREAIQDMGSQSTQDESHQPAEMDHKAYLASNRAANSVNADIHTEVLAPAIEVLDRHMINDWDSPSQLEMGTNKVYDEVAGFMRGLDNEEAMVSLKNCGRYLCAVPISLFALYYSPTPGVRLNRSKLMQVINDDSMTLSTWPTQKVALRSINDLYAMDFTSVTPEEIRIARIANIARRIRENSLTEDDLEKVSRNLWCVPTEFIIEDNKESRFFLAIQARRQHQKQARMCRRSGSQITDEIMSLWASRDGALGKKAKETK